MSRAGVVELTAGDAWVRWYSVLEGAHSGTDRSLLLRRRRQRITPSTEPKMAVVKNTIIASAKV
jgi:hypothetical protein